jgi:hypothetical protein
MPSRTLLGVTETPNIGAYIHRSAPIVLTLHGAGLESQEPRFQSEKMETEMAPTPGINGGGPMRQGARKESLVILSSDESTPKTVPSTLPNRTRSPSGKI